MKKIYDKLRNLTDKRTGVITRKYHTLCGLFGTDKHQLLYKRDG